MPYRPVFEAGIPDYLHLFFAYDEAAFHVGIDIYMFPLEKSSIYSSAEDQSQ